MGGGESSNVASYKLEGAAPHAVVLHLPGNLLNTESGSVDEPCKRKEQVIYLIGLLTKFACTIRCIVCYYVVITAEQFTRYQTSFVVLGNLSQVVYTMTYAKTFTSTIGLLICFMTVCTERSYTAGFSCNSSGKYKSC